MKSSARFSLECRPNRYIDDGEYAIYRLMASYTHIPDAMPLFSVRGCRAIVIERGSSDQNRDWSLVSVRLPKSISSFDFAVEDPSRTFPAEAKTMLSRRFFFLKAKEFLVTRDAGATHLYNRWFKKHRAMQKDLEFQRTDSFLTPLTFSIVVPLFNTSASYLSEMVRSVLAQSYSRWELILVDAGQNDAASTEILDGLSDQRIVVIHLSENGGIARNTNEGIRAAKGDMVCFLDHDDWIEPNTLYEYAKRLENRPELDILYCDEDSFGDDGVHRYPIFKPEFSPEYLLSHNYITHFLAVRNSLIRRIGLSDEKLAGAQDYDLTLRATETARAVGHIPQVLYHWRMHEGSSNTNSESKPYAQEAGRTALRNHCERMGISAEVEETDELYVYRVRYRVQGEPLVSIVIPNKDKREVLKTCVSSILDHATYRNYEIVIIENGSVDSATFDYYRELASDDRVRIETWKSDFNYSAIINFGVEKSRGDYLLLLNNDTCVIAPDFIETMLAQAQQPGVGVVGAKLLYRDGIIQHAGVSVGPWGEVVHVNQYLPDDKPGYCGRASQVSNFTAVTGACQMVSRSVFSLVDGYEESFTVGFNDIDFCCKVVEAGYRVVLEPHAKLHHDEFTSRGRDDNGKSRARFEREKSLMHERWPRYFLDGDPYMNPNFDKNALYFNLPVGIAQVRRILHRGSSVVGE